MDVKEIAAGYADYAKQIRKDFHRIPEISFKEYKTSARIAQELDQIGVEYRRCGAETGWLATLGGKKSGKTVLLRADIDALPVSEQTGVDYASEHPGTMHACGHDTHIAMLLTACRILKDMEDELNGTVKLAFQPAEEISLGAKEMVKEGALEGVDAAFSMHTWAGLKSGTMVVDPGEAMAGCGQFRITIHGQGCHGSAPEKGVDVAVTAAALIMNLQSIASREITSLTPVVVSVGKVIIDGSWNVMVNQAYLEGTTRCFDPEVAARFEGILRRICDATCAAYRATCELDYTLNTLPVVNDARVTAIAQAAAEKIVGKENMGHMGRIAGAEDFCFFMSPQSGWGVPGVQTFIGSGCDLPNHNERFLSDEDMLLKGAEVYSQFALDFLNL